MTGKPSTTMEDDRPITMLTFPYQGVDDPRLTIGCTLFGAEVTRIVAYEEPGEMGAVLWYAIYGRKPDGEDGPRRPELLYRIQAKYVEAIGYQEEGA